MLSSRFAVNIIVIADVSTLFLFGANFDIVRAGGTYDMADKKLWNIRVEQQLIDRLGRLGKRLGYPTANAFAAHALDEWAETLAEMMAELADDRAKSKDRIHDKVLGQMRSERRK